MHSSLAHGWQRASLHAVLGKQYVTSTETEVCSLLTLYGRGSIFLLLGQKWLPRFYRVLFLIKQTVQKT